MAKKQDDLKPETIARLRQRRAAGISRAQVAREVGRHESTVAYHEAQGAPDEPPAKEEQATAPEAPLEPRKEAVSDERPSVEGATADWIRHAEIDDEGGVRVPVRETPEARIARLLGEDHIKKVLADLLDPTTEGVSRDEVLKSLTLAISKGLVEIEDKAEEAPIPLTRAARVEWTQLLLHSMPLDELEELHNWLGDHMFGMSNPGGTLAEQVRGESYDTPPNV